MALASAKQLLDELMGRDRNLNPTEKRNTCNWEDPDVCKHFLVKFCPNELFVNTKADLGPCNKIHDERLKNEFLEYIRYEQSGRYRKEGYEEGFLQFCQSMLSDVEKRIRRARQRLSLGNKEILGPGGVASKSQQPPEPTDERVIVLNERIQELLRQVEQLGCEGKVEEAQGIMKLCDQLKEERRALDKDSDTNHWLKQTAELAAAQEKQMEVCDICGAFLIVGDAQQRVDDHLTGKQHVGYAKLKEAVEEILNRREKERLEKEKTREREREERRRRHGDEEPVQRSRRGDDPPPPPPSSDREERRRKRSRSPRDDRRKRSRSRERRDRERERDRDRRRSDRDRDRDRERHRDRRHGSRDRGSSKVSNGGSSPRR